MFSRTQEYDGQLDHPQMICLAFKQDYLTFDDLSKEAQESYSQLVITSKTVFKGRIKVILVGESLGF